MKRIIFIIFVFFCFSSTVYSLTESDQLKYDVEQMKVENGVISFKGWARKNADEPGENNIGGQNLGIYIAAVAADSDVKLENNVKSITDWLNGKGSISGAIVKENTKYENGNKLFGSLCYEGCSGKCCEVPHTSGLINKTSSCGYDKKTNKTKKIGIIDTCESYNTGFDISFTFDELNKEFLKNGIVSKNVEFIIFITHKKANISSYNGVTGKFDFNYSGLENKKDVFYRRLAVYDGVCSGCDDLINKLFYNFELEMSDQFYVLGHSYRISDFDEKENKLTPVTQNYFEDKKIFTIVDFNNKQKAPNGGLNLETSDTLNIYRLGTTDTPYINEKGHKIYPPGDESKYWAWSTWGVVTGSTKLTLYDNVKPDLVSECKKNDEKFNCSAGTFNVGCDDYEISHDIVDEGLNFTGKKVDGYKIKIYRKYSIEENWELSPYYEDFNGNSYGLPSEGINVKDGRFFKFNIELINNTQNDPVEWGNEYFYEVFYAYVGEDGDSKISNGVWITKDRLMPLLKDYENKKIIEDPSLLEWELNFSETNTDISYKTSNFFDSNDLDDNNKPKIIISSSNILENIDEITNKYIKLGIKKSCINKVDSRVNYIDFNSSCSSYQDTHNDHRYYIPFGFVQTIYNPKITFDVSNVSYVFDKIDYEFCKIKGDSDTKLNNYRYRVIDLTNPFPNNQHQPSSSYATNWLEMWNNNTSKSFLYDRYKKNDVERYHVLLSHDNISAIRESNVNDLRKKYLNVDISSDFSLFKSNLISSENTKVGAEEVVN